MLVSAVNTPTWLTDPLNSLLTGAPSTTNLGDELAFLWKEPLVSIIFNKSATPSVQDIGFIATIIQDKNLHIKTAVAFLYKAVGETNVNNPAFIFRLNSMWELHFQDALPDETEGLGVIVSFEGEKPVDVQALNDVEAFFDDTTVEWTK